MVYSWSLPLLARPPAPCQGPGGGGTVGWGGPERALLRVLVGHLLGQRLPGLEGLLDAGLTGDGGADLLRDLGAEVGELGDADELDARRGPRLHTRVGRVGGVDGRLGGLGEGRGCGDVLRVLVG